MSEPIPQSLNLIVFTSLAFEEVADWLGCAQTFAREGRAAEACRMLSGAAAFGRWLRCPEIVRAHDLALCRVRDGDICLVKAHGEPYYLDSAHHLFAHIIEALTMLVSRSDRGGAETEDQWARRTLARCDDILSLNVTKLVARLKGERAKLLPPPRLAPLPAAPEPPPPPPDYVTLDMMAVLLKYSKKTLERKKNRKNNPLPPPAIEGGGGKADEWVWAEIRPWLEKEFGRILPERFPSLVPPT